MKHPNLKTTALFAAALATMAATPAELDNWEVDAAHTEINFRVNHFFTPVSGTFDEFEIDLQYDEADPANSAVSVTIQVASVDTNNERRDNHLRTPDFFDASTHGEITFRSESVRVTSDTELVATGPLTIKGISRTVELPIEILGVQEIPAEMQEMLGGSKKVASFRAGIEIDRGDFEVGTGNWAATLVVGGTVEIEVVLEAAYR